MKKDSLTLKWRTLKAWDFHSEKALKLLKEYGKLGHAWGAAQQHDTPRQKEIICELIDEGNFEKVYLDWDGKYISKAEAKKYVMDYITYGKNYRELNNNMRNGYIGFIKLNRMKG